MGGGGKLQKHHYTIRLFLQKMRALFMKARCRNAGYNPLCTPLLPNEVEDYEAKKGIKERRGDATWLMTHGDRPHHTLGLPKANEPLPSKNKHAPPSGIRPPHQRKGDLWCYFSKGAFGASIY